MSGQGAPLFPTDTTMASIIKAVTDAGALALAGILSGAGATVALAALGRTLLGDAEGTPGDILAALQPGDSDVRLRIQEAEQTTLAKLSMADTPFDFTQFFPADRMMTANDLTNTQDARQMQIKLHDKTNQRLAYSVTAGFFVLIVLVVFYPDLVKDGTTAITDTNGNKVSIPNPSETAMRNILFTLLGVVATGWSNIIGFYFGSSAGSEQKSQTLSAALAQASANAAGQRKT